MGSIPSELPVEFRRLENVEYRAPDDDVDVLKPFEVVENGKMVPFLLDQVPVLGILFDRFASLTRVRVVCRGALRV